MRLTRKCVCVNSGVKFKDADLIRIPRKLVVGRDAALGKVELIQRTNRRSKVLESKEATKELVQEIFASRS